ncbi:FAD-binding oxidoreductase [Nakamurella flava]|uniref:FAD-binding oxidoreductase n=1 Tax=Nakamurella flava TaxID=2576308 RepID=A0A4U6QJJ5_9ACTN|nr:FAD-binding oxidoreductase [Nakamurella flava]TKV60248.1 FAD-binding oxidoreductase [Nakamurella flava]
MTTAHDLGEPTLTGRIVRPDDDGYDAARTPWNHFVARRPAAVVYAASTRDVIAAVGWARRRGLEIRVRSGGHSLEGFSSVDGGVVVDVSGLKSADFTPGTAGGPATARLGAGLTQIEAVTALGRHGLAVPTGNEGSVGLVGATLGGGFGLLTRPFGMASDHLLGVEIVVPDGEQGARSIWVDADHHADLLWALRGGGNGGFGIVTTMLARVQPLSTAVLVTASWPGVDRLHDVFDAWQRSAPTTDDRLTSQLEIRRGKIELFAVLAHGTTGEATRLLAPVLDQGDPSVDIVEKPWAELYSDIQIPGDEEPANWKFTSQFIRSSFPAEAIDVVAAFMAAAPTSQCNYFTQAFGGAVPTSEPTGGSTFAHRDALFYAEPGAGWGDRRDPAAAQDPRTADCLAWIADFSTALAPYVDGAYVNVPNADEPEWARAYWRGNVDRLRQVKAAYDPDDVFHHQQTITPIG